MLTAGVAVTHKAQCGKEHVDEFHGAGTVNFSVHLHLSGRDMLVTEEHAVASRGGPRAANQSRRTRMLKAHLNFLRQEAKSAALGVIFTTEHRNKQQEKNTVRTWRTFTIDV